MLENSTELTGTVPQQTRHAAVQSNSLPLLEPHQLFPHLADWDVQSCLRGGGCGRVCVERQQVGEVCCRVVGTLHRTTSTVGLVGGCGGCTSVLGRGVDGGWVANDYVRD